MDNTNSNPLDGAEDWCAVEGTNVAIALREWAKWNYTERFYAEVRRQCELLDGEIMGAQ